MDTNVHDFVQNRVVPHLVKSENKTLPATVLICKPEDVFFVSDLIFTEITFKDDAKPLSIIVKRWPTKAVFQFAADMYAAFFNNEILFYNRYIKHCKNQLPKVHYVHDSEKDSFLVLENVSSRGYSISPKNVHLDLDYVMASIQEVAKFHSTGYILKSTNPEELKDIVSKIKEYKFTMKNEKFRRYVNAMATRSLQHLNSINYDPIFCHKMQQILENAMQTAIVDVVKPVEPLATICHGDFLRNNILYNSSGTEVKAMLIDFATIRYASPGVDLSTFFFMSVSRQDVLHRFDQFMKLYYDTLHRILRDNKVSNLERFSYEALIEDYKRCAIHGFVIATFFLPVVIYGNPEGASFEDFWKSTPEEHAAKGLKIGGDEMTKLLADMLLDMKNMGCLDRFLN